MLSLSQIKPGEKVLIKSLCATGNMKRRFLDIGLVKNTLVECVGQSPLGDPKAYLIRGAIIAIRSNDADKISVEYCR